MPKLYLRIHPYDRAKGHLCRRYTVAGRTYAAGQWYAVEPKLAELLREEKQGNAEVFEILNEGEWREKARSEVYAHMMMRGGALPGALPTPQASAAPKTGPVKGKYDDFRNADVEEVDANSALSDGARTNVAEVTTTAKTEDAADDEGMLDLDNMTKAELIKTAEEYEVDLEPLGSRPTKDEIRTHLDKEIFG